MLVFMENLKIFFSIIGYLLGKGIGREIVRDNDILFDMLKLINYMEIIFLVLKLVNSYEFFIGID